VIAVLPDVPAVWPAQSPRLSRNKLSVVASIVKILVESAGLVSLSLSNSSRRLRDLFAPPAGQVGASLRRGARAP